MIILLSFNKNHLNGMCSTQKLLENPVFKEYMYKNGCKAVKNLKTL